MIFRKKKFHKSHEKLYVLHCISSILSKMLRNETNWIGFQEVRNTICNLKQEVENVEKRIHTARRSFNQQTATSKSYEVNVPYRGQLIYSQLPKSKESEDKIFSKKSVPSIISLFSDEKTTVPKKIFSTSEEEPDICPSKFSPIPLLDVCTKKTLISPYDNLLSTTDDSVSVTDLKNSSSERTSSLIADHYKEADKSHAKYEVCENVTRTDVSKSSTSEISKHENDSKKKKKVNTQKLLDTRDISMEWTDVSKNKAFSLQNKFKTESIHKLKDIIDRQKKRQELYQLQLEQDILGSTQPVSPVDIYSNFNQLQPSVKDDQVLPVPVRKVRKVKSLPIYKGFSAPPENLSINKRWRKQRNKHTIANSSSFKNYGSNPPKRIKAAVKSENNFVSTLYGQNASKSTKIANKDESCNKQLDSIDSESFKEHIQGKESDNKQIGDVKPTEDNINLKTDIQSISKSNQLSDENSLEDVKDTTLSFDGPKEEEIFIRNKNQNILKEAKKAPISNVSKIKAKTLQEQNVSSPKIRSYDREKVREFMKRKKKERRKRHSEDRKKKKLEDQKKKESLEKLIEYQKQNAKAVAKLKPLSPAKVSQNDNLNAGEHENTIDRIEHAAQSSTLENVSHVQEKEKIIPYDSGLKRKTLEDAQKKDDSVKKHASISNSHKKERGNLHIDISIPKIISVPDTSILVHPVTAKNGKDNLISSNGVHAKPVKTAADLESPTKLLTESSAKETVIKTTEYKDIKDLSMDIADSNIFTNISSVSTPSRISQITGVDSVLLEEIKVCEAPFPEIKKEKNRELKELIERMNVLTEPIEPLLYTKQWLSKNPLPPKSRVLEMANSTKQQHFYESTNDHNIHGDISQDKNLKESSFKRQISGIGDISQLYDQILGRKSTKEAIGFENQSVMNKDRQTHHKSHQHHIDEDKIIEDSLKSEAGCMLDKVEQRNSEVHHHSEPPDHSSHFTDLQKENVIPDPFNFINTFKKKPLGFTLQNKKVKSKCDMSSKISIRNTLLEEKYKSMLNTSEDTKFSESFTNETVGDQKSLNEEEKTPSFTSETQNGFTSRTDIQTETSFNASDTVANSSNISSSKLSISSSNKLSMKSLSKNNASNKSDSQKSRKSKKDAELNNISQTSSHKLAASHKTSSKTIDIAEEIAENVLNVNTSNVSDVILSGTINSEYTLESEKDSSTAVSSAHSSNASDMIISGNITSEYTLDMDDENHSDHQESDKEEVEEGIKEQSNEKASVSESSISEVISVVENSKGFRSSMEDLLSNRSMRSEDLEHSAYNCSNNKPHSVGKELSKHISEDSTKHQFDNFSISDKQSISQSYKALKSDVEQPALLHETDQIHSIPSGSQNGITIDFRQPLRFTLSNGESIQTNQGLNMHESQYLHTQVVTRVASEAAAAAATSAVIAVFETQKVLLAEKTHFEIMNPCRRSSNKKKTQYSSDFESSADAKSSSPSLHSCAIGSKHSESMAEDLHVSDNNEISLKSESVEEEIVLNHSDSDHVTPQNSLNKREGNQSPVLLESIGNAGQPISEKRKISSNISSPSPPSLSEQENGSLTTEISISSHKSESAVSDDSFAELSLEFVRKMTEEDDLYASHQLNSLKLQEKSLVQKARNKMRILETLKKKWKQKGSQKEVSNIRRAQKDLILRLRQERFHLQYMQEAYRSICEKHNVVSKDKKKLLKEPSLLTFESESKDDKLSPYKYPDSKLKEIFLQKSSSSTSSSISDNNEKHMINEDSTSEVPEVLREIASNSSQESVIESQPSEIIKTSGSSQNKSQKSSPNPQFIPLNSAISSSNPAIHSSNSLESVLQGIKKLEASKRHLTKREQRILQRRKKVEHLLQWQKKLDNEEMAVRELEKKVLDIVDHSRKKTKYYVSSSGSTNQDVLDDKRSDLNHLSLALSSETPSQYCKQSEQSPVQYIHQNENTSHKAMSDESIHTNFSVNELEAKSDAVKGSDSASIVTHSSSLQEEIKPEKVESSIQTAEVTENGSQAEEIVSEEISNQISPSIKDKSSSSDVYSEPLEATGSKKSPSVLSISPPFKYSSPSKSIKKDHGPGIRLPLLPRNLRRHDSSGSDDSYTISQSETASDQSDIEVRIHALSVELKLRKAEADKLKKEQKKKKREHLKEKELSLQKQLEAYNQYIHQTKLELDQQIESSVSPQTGDVFVKPRIKWPRPEKVVDSRRVRKQASLNSDTFGLEKKTETINRGELSENLEVASSKEKDERQKRLLSEPFQKSDEENTKKEISEKSTDDSKEISEALSVDNSSKAQEASEIMTINSASSEVSSEKIISEINENASSSSAKSQVYSDIKSLNSDPKHSDVISSQHESKISLNRSYSKSLTDTFTSETTSSKISDLNSLQVDENIVSNATISSDDEISTKAKNVSEDLTIKCNLAQSCNASHETGSSEESLSEILSVNNSVSFEEELDCESSSKNSKCNNSEGCEAFSKKEVIDGKNVPEKLFVTALSKENATRVLDEVSSTVSPVKVEKKDNASESKVIAIVNYVSTSLMNDAFFNLFEIYNKRGIYKSISNHKSHGNNLQVESPKLKEKAAETLILSLLDLHLEDAFATLFRNLKKQKTKSQKSMLLLSNTPNLGNDIQTVDSLSSSSALDSSATVIVGDTSEFPLNQLPCDINSNQIFIEPVNLNINYLTTSESEQQLQQQQLVLQQYSYFYRKIPNKPPPPYTPPSSSTVSSEFPFVKQKPVEKTIAVKNVIKHIHEVVDHILEVIIDGKSKGLHLSDISLPKEDVKFSKLDLSAPSQLIFIEFVFDLTKEIILEKFSETKQVPQPWLRPRKLTPKPVIPSSKEKIMNCIQKDIEKALKINDESKNSNKRRQIVWSSLKLGRKKRDFVDTILINELKEEEPDWVNYDQDEMTVKLQIADSIFNVLINDTICMIKNLQQKVQV